MLRVRAMFFFRAPLFGSIEFMLKTKHMYVWRVIINNVYNAHRPNAYHQLGYVCDLGALTTIKINQSHAHADPNI